jgi:hypothetical protein
MVNCFGHEVLVENMSFFVVSISGNVDDLHSVKERGVKSLKTISRAEEENLGKVDGDV